MKTYVEMRLAQCKNKDLNKCKEILNDIYNECEIRGIKHADCFLLIQECLIENIRKLGKELNDR